MSKTIEDRLRDVHEEILRAEIHERRRETDDGDRDAAELRRIRGLVQDAITMLARNDSDDHP